MVILKEFNSGFLAIQTKPIHMIFINRSKIYKHLISVYICMYIIICHIVPRTKVKLHPYINI